MGRGGGSSSTGPLREKLALIVLGYVAKNFSTTRTLLYLTLLLLYFLSIDLQLTSSYHLSAMIYSDSLLNSSNRVPRERLYAYVPVIADMLPRDDGLVAAHSAGYIFWVLTSSWLARSLNLDRGPAYLNHLAILNIVSTILTLLSIVYIEKIARIYLRPQEAVLLAFSYAIGSLSWVYSAIAYSQSFSAPFVAAGLYNLLVYLRCGRLRSLALANVFLSIATSSDHALILLWLGALILIALRSTSAGKVALGCFCCYVLSLIPTVLYYTYVTGTIIPTQTLYALHLGVEPLDISRVIEECSLFELLFGPRKSILLTSPALMLLALGSLRYIKRASNEERMELAYSLAGFTLGVLVYSAWYDWHGGLSYGPRLTYSVLPLLTVPVSVALRYGGGCVRLTLLCLSAVGAIFNAIVIATNHFSCAYQDIAHTYIPQPLACNLPLLLTGCRSPTVLGLLGISCVGSAVTLLSSVTATKFLLAIVSRVGGPRCASRSSIC